MTNIKMPVSATTHAKVHYSRDQLSDAVWDLVQPGTKFYDMIDGLVTTHPNYIAPGPDGNPYDSDTNNVLFRAFMRRAFQAWIDHDQDVIEAIVVCSETN